MTILITGSAGLIGAVLTKHLEARGMAVSGADVRALRPEHCINASDIEGSSAVMREVSGVVHLGAVSRVIHGERDPARCWQVNVEITRKLLAAAAGAPRRPWFIYASSREVYGVQDRQPVSEDAPLQPMNVYARSKVAAEVLLGEAREAGLTTSILRFANVYGRVEDHPDRVVPAFLAAAVAGGVLRVDGRDCAFDLNHVDDVVRGIAAVIEALNGGERALPALHFVSGRSTTLLELADMCRKIGGIGARITEAPSRTFDVHRFVGDPRRAERVLGWRSAIDLQTGLSRLAAEFARKLQ